MPVHHVLSTAFLESGSPLIKPLFAALRYTKKEVVISEKTLHLTVTVPEGLGLSFLVILRLFETTIKS